MPPLPPRPRRDTKTFQQQFLVLIPSRTHTAPLTKDLSAQRTTANHGGLSAITFYRYPIKVLDTLSPKSPVHVDRTSYKNPSTTHLPFSTPSNGYTPPSPKSLFTYIGTSYKTSLKTPSEGIYSASPESPFL